MVVAREVCGLARGLVDLLLARARRLGMFHHLGGILLGKIGHELEIDDLPRRDVEAVGENGDQDPHGECSAERQLPVGDIVAVGADAEEDEQPGQHYGGIAKNESLVATEFVQKRNRGEHGHGRDHSGDHSEDQNGLSHFNSSLSNLWASRDRFWGGAPRIVVIPLGDFAVGAEKLTFEGGISGDQARFLPKLHGLGAALGTQLIEQAAGMGLYRILANEEPLGDFAVTEPRGDESEDFEFSRGDGEFGQTLPIGSKRLGRDGSVDDLNLLSGKSESEPYAETSEEGRDESAVDFHRMFDYEEPVLRKLQNGDEDAATSSVNEDVA